MLVANGSFYNTCVGDAAAQSLSTGQTNTMVGNSAGQAVTTGSNNTIVGQGANVTNGSQAECLVMGQGATAPASMFSKSDGLLAMGSSGVPLVTNTSATGGAASALPLLPAGYLAVWLNGAAVNIPYFN